MQMKDYPSRPQPGADGRWNRPTWADPNVTDAFKNTLHNEIDAMKNAPPGSTNIGPGASPLARETFRVLRAGERDAVQVDAKSTTEYSNLQH